MADVRITARPRHDDEIQRSCTSRVPPGRDPRYGCSTTLLASVARDALLHRWLMVDEIAVLAHECDELAQDGPWNPRLTVGEEGHPLCRRGREGAVRRHVGNPELDVVVPFGLAGQGVQLVAPGVRVRVVEVVRLVVDAVVAPLVLRHVVHGDRLSDARGTTGTSRRTESVTNRLKRRSAFCP